MSVCTLTQKDNTGKNFTDCDFSGQDLSGYIFKSCTLTGTNFTGCTFDTVSDFTGALFGKSATGNPTKFTGCDLTNPRFSAPARFGGLATAAVPTDLTKAKIPWVLLGKTQQYVNLTGVAIPDMPADLSMSQLTGVKWNNFDFTGKSFANSHFMNCDLSGSILTGVDLDYVSFIQICNLTGVKMNKCSLYHTVFDTSTLTNTDLSYSTKIAGCSFLNTLLKGTIFDGNDLTTSKFGVPNQTSTDSDYITSYQFATLTTDFLITNLQKKWQCADFRNVIVPGFNTITNQLYNLQAGYSLFNNTLCFEQAKLNGSDFSYATFNGVKFNNASMNNISLIGAQTAQGSVLGPAAAVFTVSQGNTALKAPYDYASFLASLTSSNLNNIISVFLNYTYSIGNISCTAMTDPASQNPAWKITDQNSLPNRTYMVVNAPITGNGQSQLLVYDESPSSFSYATMVGSALEACSFTNAKMDHAQLFGAVITFSDLSNADMTGAQMGKNTSIFSVSQADTTIAAPYDFATFLSDLQMPDIGKITDLFQHYGYVMGSVSCAAANSVPAGAKAAWEVTDSHILPARKFLVVQNPISQSTQYEMDVYFEDGSPTILDGSYMPGIILTQANLTGCSAVGCHLYNDQRTSSQATLNHTTLVEVRFDNSNLFQADFTSAVVSGASFINANLMGSTFKGVVLDAAQSGHVVSFNNANLQGVDFSASTIKGANFLGAAICLPASTNNPGQTNGVWLAGVPKTDGNLAAYMAELDNASTFKAILQPPPSTMATQFLLPGTIKANLLGALKNAGIIVDASSVVSVADYESTWQITDGTKIYLIIPGYDSEFTVAYNVYLSGNAAVQCSLPYPYPFQTGTITSTLISDILQGSTDKIDLSATATVNTYQRPALWTVLDPVNNKTYSVWWGVELLLNKLNNVTYVRAAFSVLKQLFAKWGGNLRDQSFVTKSTDTTANTTTWMVDIGKEDAYYLNTGYVQFKVVGNSATAPTQLDVYGYTIRMSGLGNNQQEVIQDFDCDVTKITADVMDDQTLMPNNATKILNVNSGKPFSQWMQITNGVPQPPVCVPTGISYCQRPTKMEDTIEALSHFELLTTIKTPTNARLVSSY